MVLTGNTEYGNKEYAVCEYTVCPSLSHQLQEDAEWRGGREVLFLGCTEDIQYLYVERPV